MATSSTSLLTTSQIIAQAVSSNARLGMELLEMLRGGYAAPELHHVTTRILAINDSLTYIVMYTPTLAERQQALDYLLTRLPRPVQPRQVINTLYELTECECDPVPGDPQAAAPIDGIVDDVLDTFTFTLSANYLSATDYEYSINGMGYQPVSTGSPISNGRLVLGGLTYVIPVGQLKVRVKQGPGHQASSPLLNLDPYTITASLPIPEAPSVLADDNLDTLSFDAGSFTNEIVVSINGAPFVPYTGQYAIGDINLNAGVYVAKVKATSAHQESATTSSPSFTKKVVQITAFVGAFKANPTASEIQASRREQWGKESRMTTTGNAVNIACYGDYPAFAEPQSQGVRTSVFDKNGFELRVGDDIRRVSISLNINNMDVLYWLYIHLYPQDDPTFVYQLSAL